MSKSKGNRDGVLVIDEFKMIPMDKLKAEKQNYSVPNEYKATMIMALNSSDGNWYPVVEKLN